MVATRRRERGAAIALKIFGKFGHLSYQYALDCQSRT